MIGAFQATCVGLLARGHTAAAALAMGEWERMARGVLLPPGQWRRPAIGGAALVAAIVVAGCTSSQLSPAPRSPSSTPITGTSPSQSLAPGAPDFGPLAVVPASDDADTARTEGILQITDTCVFLLDRGGPVLLLWPANHVAWNAVLRTITFDNLDGTSVTVGHGESVVLGGGGGSSAESGVAPEVWSVQMTWVQPPRVGCNLDPYWSVGDVRH